MGLHATVYRNLKNLPAHLRERVIVLEPDSGELDWRDHEDERIFGSDKLEACSEYIGNIAFAALIREEIAQAFGHQESLLSTRVVYSGSHAGDWIAFSDLGKLKEEVDALDRQAAPKSPALAHFIAQMRSLIAGANREGTGICF
jgi:hypothetical protein